MKINLEIGEVIEIIDKTTELTELLVQYLDGKKGKAISYHQFARELNAGDQVLCNKTATDLKLGTGGIDFVITNLSNPQLSKDNPGHIMKLRYTPLQFAIESVEEAVTPFHQLFNEEAQLDRMPVIIGSLHSILAPTVLGIKYANSKLKIAYIMSEGGCLPLQLSKNVAKLKKEKLLEATITFGHTFGGDYEAVNIYSALLTAKHCVKADIAIVAMGPGIVGTGTLWGNTGLEQGTIANNVTTLGGRPLLVPRISFNDTRKRHWGFSHHTITVLKRICQSNMRVALPILEDDITDELLKQLLENQLADKHQYILADGSWVFEESEKYRIELKTMGRGYQQEAPFFAAGGAAGVIAAGMLGN